MSKTWEPVSWDDVRAELIANGKLSEEGLAKAGERLNAYVTGYRLAELRHQAGLTQTQLAQYMGVTQSRISAMERGDMDPLTLASIRTYIAALGGAVRVVASLADIDINSQLPAA